MKISKFGIVLCLCSFVATGFGTNMTTNGNVKPGKIIGMKNWYHVDNKDISREHTTQSAAQCKCVNGKCVEKDGKSICTCPPEFGVHEYGGKVECRPCNCGKESNCTFNAYFWSTTVNCICKDGYKVVNNSCKGPCTNNPCKNGGTCADENKTFKCICPPGYSGKICENKGPCSSNPCQNGGVCILSGSRFKCLCKNPFSGNTCEIDPCTSNPCKNNGVCLIEGDSFMCACKEPFRGQLCEIDPCTSNPCKNNGVCLIEDDSFMCACKEPFSGQLCESDPCTSNPCKNNGVCLIDGDSFMCACKEPFSGQLCEIDPCTSNPCKNNGVCLIVGDSFMCACKEPFSGQLCEIDPCSSNPCQNGGECRISEKSYECLCKMPFSGNRCEIDPCTPNPCERFGICSIENGSFLCTCHEPFYGKICEKGPCDREPCKNNGSCTWLSTTDGLTFYCHCIEPYFGDTCEEERHACERHNPSKNGGECFEKGKDYFCSCREGLTGKNCTESEWCVYTGNEACVNVPCVYDSHRNTSLCQCEHSLLYNMKSKRCEPCYCGDHGTCESEDGMKTCVCEENYMEKDGICYDRCDPNPCWNFGKCIARSNGNYTCICEEPFTGKICEEQIQPSTAISSTFTATVTQPNCDCGVKSFDCKVDSRGRKRCFCLPGFAQKGNTCSETCNSDADCFNGGTCEKMDDAFFCVCPENFLGDRCQVNAACDTLRMRCDAKRAVCRQTRDGAVCECPPDKAYKWFSGVCEDICDSRKCLNGKCEITGRSFKCVCDDGYSGYRCDEKIIKNEGLAAYIIGLAMFSMAVLLSTFATLCLVCVLRRFTKANRIKCDIE